MNNKKAPPDAHTPDGAKFKTIRKDMPNKQKNIKHTIAAARNLAGRAQASADLAADAEKKEADLAFAHSMLEEATRNQERLNQLIAYKQENGYPT